MNQHPTFDVFKTSDLMIRHLPQPALILDGAGRVVAANAAYDKLTSISHHALIGKDMRASLNKTSAHALAQLINDPAPPEGVLIDLQAFGALLQANVHPLLDQGGGIKGYLCLGLLPEQTDLDEFQGLRNREMRWRTALESAGHAVWDTAGDASYFVTDSWYNMRGIDQASMTQEEPNEWMTEVHPDDLKTIDAAIQRQNEEQQNEVHYQYRNRHRDGHWIWILSKGRVVSRDADGLPHRVIGIDTDITELKKIEFAARELSDRLQVTVDASDIGIWDLKPSTGALRWNDNMYAMHGMPTSDLSRRFEDWMVCIHPDDRAEVRSSFDACLADQRDFRVDYRSMGHDGITRHLRMSAKYIFDMVEQSACILGVDIDRTSDVMLAQEAETARIRVEYDSRHDALTGLGNRRLLDEAFTDFNSRTGFRQHSVLHIDIDYFKQINDNFGHLAGDQVLQHVSKITSAIIGDAGLVARVGGDEIVVFLPAKTDDQALLDMAEKIVKTVAEPFCIDQKDCRLTISVGVATAKRRYANPERLFVDADMALYQAKKKGRNCVVHFSDSIRRAVKAEENLAKDLSAAIENREITCYYQPQFDARTRQAGRA